MTTAEAPQTVPFKAEVQQLLHILSAALYTDREIFLRELISNASDALRRVQFALLTDNTLRDPEAELAIRVASDEQAHTLTISDNGIGMTQTEMIDLLGTIAQSGARAALERLEQAQRSDIIGQFGVGFYSVFAVADRVTVTSLSAQPDSEGAQWEATGGAEFTVGPGERTERGTTITLLLKEDAYDFAQSWKLRQIIKKHSDFVAFPVFLDDERVNQKTSLWRRAPRDVAAEDYNQFYQQLTFDFQPPLAHIHVSTDSPLDLHAVIFIPATRERGMLERRTEGKIKLYSRNILIQEEAADLLPKHFRFMEGVVDSEDLPLNVSRESIQRGPQQRIAQVLNKRILRELSDMAEKQPETFATFQREFGVFLKEGIAIDPQSKDDLAKLLRFNTTAGDDLVALADYKARMPEGQTDIYYVLGNDLASVRHSPHLDAFTARNLEVLLLHDVMDSFMLNSLKEWDGARLRSVDDADLELPALDAESALPALDDAAFDALALRFKDELGEQIVRVQPSKLLQNSPARLVAGDNDPQRHMQRVQRMFDRDYSVPAKVIELNPRHPLLHRLAALVQSGEQSALLSVCVHQVYNNALVLEGLHPNPAAMVGAIQQLMEAAVGVPPQGSTTGD